LSSYSNSNCQSLEVWAPYALSVSFSCVGNRRMSLPPYLLLVGRRQTGLEHCFSCLKLLGGVAQLANSGLFPTGRTLTTTNSWSHQPEGDAPGTSNGLGCVAREKSSALARSAAESVFSQHRMSGPCYQLSRQLEGPYSSFYRQLWTSSRLERYRPLPAPPTRPRGVPEGDPKPELVDQV
jgi:hypothetical protein